MFRRHLEEKEVIARVVHKHWLLGARELFWPTLFVLLCVGFLALQPAIINMTGAHIKIILKERHEKCDLPFIGRSLPCKFPLCLPKNSCEY